MNVSTRFTVALHVLTLLASNRDQPLTSEYIAGSVNTNAVVIRRLLGMLRKAGFVSSQGGAGGGWELKVDPDSITLARVRQAVNDGPAFAFHSRQPNSACPVGRNIQAALGGIYERAELAIQDELARTSILGILRSVQARNRK